MLILNSRLDFKRINEILSQEKFSGADSLKQLLWLFFLKYLDHSEATLEQIDEGSGKKHYAIIDHDFRWSSWAIRDWRDSNDFLSFINHQLFPYLQDLSDSAGRKLVGNIFSKIGGSKFESGSNLMELVSMIESIKIGYDSGTHSFHLICESLVSISGPKNMNLEIKKIMEKMIRLIEKLQSLTNMRNQEGF